MGLFSNPQVINDGVADRTFVFKGQSFPKDGSLIGEYVEPAAAIAAQSKVLAKHSETSKLIRSVVQSTEVEYGITGVELGRVTVNVSYTYAKTNTSAFVKKRAKLATNAVNLAGATDNILLRLV